MALHSEKLACERIHRFSDLVRLESEWNELHPESSYPSLYNSFTYIATAVEAFTKPPTEICFITVREGPPGRGLVAIFPFQIASKKRFNGTYRVLEYAAVAESDKPYPVISKDREGAAWKAVSTFLSTISREWEVFELWEVRNDLAANRLVPQLFRRFGHFVRMNVASQGPILSLDGDWDAFVAKHKNMRKKLKKVRNAIPNMRFVVHDSPSDCGRCFETYKCLEQKSWKSGRIGVSKNQETEWFYRRIFERLSMESRAIFASLMDGDTMMAGCIAYTLGQTVYFCQVTYDESYAKYSPGTVVVSLFIKYFQGTHAKRIDFLSGFAHYVDPWATEIVTANRITVYKATLKMALDYLFSWDTNRLSHMVGSLSRPTRLSARHEEALPECSKSSHANRNR